LIAVTLALLAWGDRHYADPREGPPVVLRHDPCDANLVPRTVCSCCGTEVAAAAVSVRTNRTREA
jgi:hypothetical protein